MGVEGLNLTPHLNIPVRGRDIHAILVIDKNVSKCVDVNVWSRTGDYLCQYSVFYTKKLIYSQLTIFQSFMHIAYFRVNSHLRIF